MSKQRAGKVEVLKGKSGVSEPAKKVDLERYGSNYDKIFRKKEKPKNPKD